MSKSWIPVQMGTTNRITQDVLRVLHSLRLVFDAKRVFVNKNNKGRRHVAKEDGQERNQGGKFQKNSITYVDVPLHHEAEMESKKRIIIIEMFTCNNSKDDNDVNDAIIASMILIIKTIWEKWIFNNNDPKL